MSEAANIAAALAKLPPALRDLVLAEVAAGNAVANVSREFPARPGGLCVRLSQRVTTRPRASTQAIRFVERHGASHGGEFVDCAGLHAVVEPPLPASVERDMEAIRQEMRERERASDEQRMRDTFW